MAQSRRICPVEHYTKAGVLLYGQPAGLALAMVNKLAATIDDQT